MDAPESVGIGAWVVVAVGVELSNPVGVTSGSWGVVVESDVGVVGIAVSDDIRVAVVVEVALGDSVNVAVEVDVRVGVEVRVAVEVRVGVGAACPAVLTQLPVPESVKVCPAMGTNSQS